MGNTDCKGCSAADPTTDTVKVNGLSTEALAEGTLLAATEAGKSSPKHQAADERSEQVAQELAEKEERARREAEEQRLREAEEHHRRAEARAKEEEEARAKEEECAREAAAQAEHEAAARLAIEQKSVEERKRLAEEQAQRDAQQKSDAFLKSHGFKNATGPKTSCMKVTYPLHAAVQENKPEVVVALLRCGADKKVKNGAGKSPLELAQNLNKRDSHQGVIAVLA